MRIIKKHKMYKSPDLVFEAKMDENGQLIKSSLETKTFKGNGKENGTYRIDGSRDTGIKANFYSRKAVKVNLAQSPVLLERAYVLMLNPSTEERTSKEGISVLNSFTRSTKRAIDVAKGLSERTINFDASDFNMESALGLEIHAVEMLRNIKGEVLVEGFVQRIDEFLEQFDMSKRASYQMKPMIGAGK